jgi:hypothetical protein
MLQVASAKVQAANVKCKVSKWATTIVNKKCLKLWVVNVTIQTTSVKCKVSKWTSVRVFNEWVRFRIFKLMKGRNNKRSQKPLNSYSHPIHHYRHVRVHGARRSSKRVVVQEKCRQREILQHHWQSSKFHYNSPIMLGLTF